MEATTEITPPVPSFVPSPFKKRRFIRRRTEEDGNNNNGDSPNIAAATAQSAPLSPPATSDRVSEENGDAPNLSEILRLRKKIARTSTRRGLEVTAPKPAPAIAEITAPLGPEDDAAAKAAAEEAELQAVVNRFTHQTGQILDVDKHMMAYIESEMQRRRGGGTAAQNSDGSSNANDGSNQQGENTSKSAYWTPVVPEGRGATLGKLHEVDLGEETKKRNIVRTQEATRRLQGDGSTTVEQDEEEEEEAVGGKKKMKGRRRRNSQDIQRDKLVEEVLKESRCVFLPFPFAQSLQT